MPIDLDRDREPVDAPAAQDSPPRRAQIVLSRDSLHRLLGLPDDVEVVTVWMQPDPEQVRVVIGGPGVPDVGMMRDVPWSVMAGAGEAEAPILWHPVQGDGARRPALRWGDWRPGDERDSVQRYEALGAGRLTAEQAARLVFVALGQASACWERLDEAGEFDSVMAAKVGRDLLTAFGFEVPVGYR